MPLEEKEVEIKGRKFILSKFPAIAGREIVAKYPLSSLPKVGDYAVNEETMLKLMSYVYVVLGEGHKQALNTRALVDAQCGDWETLIEVERQMIVYNCSFFQNGLISNFLRDSALKLPQLITKILTDSLRQLSPTEKPPSTN